MDLISYGISDCSENGVQVEPTPKTRNAWLRFFSLPDAASEQSLKSRTKRNGPDNTARI